MGYDLQQITVSVRLSKHNDKCDVLHDQLFKLLQEEIRKLVAISTYREIEATVI